MRNEPVVFITLLGVETPGNIPDPTPIENLTLPEQEPLPEDPAEIPET
ncbi:hypothetical protein [Methanosarcina horonobensis]|nr:hypothetical protein [Methanosarcina horonobensis]